MVSILTPTGANQTPPLSGVCLLTTIKKNTLLPVGCLENRLHNDIEISPVTVHHLQNKSLPWDYDFRFVIEEISNINDKEQVRDDYISEEQKNNKMGL